MGPFLGDVVSMFAYVALFLRRCCDILAMMRGLWWLLGCLAGLAGRLGWGWRVPDGKYALGWVVNEALLGPYSQLNSLAES